jgi:hypothetical protein
MNEITCRHCGEPIHPAHPAGYGTFLWVHDRGGMTRCKGSDGRMTGTAAEPQEQP